MIILPWTKYIKMLWKMPYLAYKCKAEVVSKFHLFKNTSKSEFPCLLQWKPLSTPSTHTKNTRREPQAKLFLINALRLPAKMTR